MPTSDHTTSNDDNEASLSREAHLDRLVVFTKQNAGAVGVKRKADQKAYYAANQESFIASQKRYHEANPEKRSEFAKRYHEANPHKRREMQLRYSYGLTMSAYEAMLESQDFRCLICKTRFGSTRLLEPCVDHCHSTGKIRGILCRGCNQGLGLFCDKQKLLRAAIRYLAQHAISAVGDTVITSEPDGT